MGMVCILILVYMNIFKAVLVIAEDLGLGFQQFHSFSQQVVKVQGVIGPELGGVQLVNFGHPAGIELLGLTAKLFRALKHVFGFADS